MPQTLVPLEVSRLIVEKPNPTPAEVVHVPYPSRIGNVAFGQKGYWALYAYQSTVQQISVVLPIVAFMDLFAILFLHEAEKIVPHLADNLLATGTVILGLVLFLEGLKAGLMPLGEAAGHALAARCSRKAVLLAAFVIGAGCTYAEPSIATLRLMGKNVDPAADPHLFWLLGTDRGVEVLLAAIAAGVGAAATVGAARFQRQASVKPLLARFAGAACALTLATVALSALLPGPPTSGLSAACMALAWDCGAVTTGPVTVPLVISLGIGLAGASSPALHDGEGGSEEAARGGRDDARTDRRHQHPHGGSSGGSGGGSINGDSGGSAGTFPPAAAAAAGPHPPPHKEVFGIVALASIAPVIAVQLLQLLRCLWVSISGPLLLLPLLPLPPPPVGASGEGQEPGEAGTGGSGAGSNYTAAPATLAESFRYACRSLLPLVAFLVFLLRVVLRMPRLPRIARCAEENDEEAKKAAPSCMSPCAFFLGPGPSEDAGARPSPAGGGATVRKKEEDDEDEEEKEEEGAHSSAFEAAAALPPRRPAAAAAAAAAAANGAGGRGGSRGAGCPASSSSPPPRLSSVLPGCALALVGLALYNNGLVNGLDVVGNEVGAALPGAYGGHAPAAAAGGAAAEGGMRRARPFAGSPAAGVCLVEAFVFALTAWATAAEPALRAFTLQVKRCAGPGQGAAGGAGAGSGQGLATVLAVWTPLGVAAGVSLGVGALVADRPGTIVGLLVAVYPACLGLNALSGASEALVSIAWDAAGVTTGEVTVPLILSFGVALANAAGVAGGFGLLALASALAIALPLAAGIARERRASAYRGVFDLASAPFTAE